jgi:hypothetical protein
MDTVLFRRWRTVDGTPPATEFNDTNLRFGDAFARGQVRKYWLMNNDYNIVGPFFLDRGARTVRVFWGPDRNCEEIRSLNLQNDLIESKFSGSIFSSRKGLMASVVVEHNIPELLSLFRLNWCYMYLSRSALSGQVE